MARILVIDDEQSIRETLKEILEFEKYEVDLAADGKEALAKIEKENYDVALCDIKMPKMDGIELLSKATALNPDLPIIMISGHGNVDIAVDAVKKGAYDFITKPPDLNRLLIAVRNAVDKNDLIVETKVLKRKVKKTNHIIGDSPAIESIKKTIDKVAPTEAKVLITGGNGSGKELVARWLHELSDRNTKPFVEVNCAAIPSELIESELFGHEKGSFTSAVKQRIGKFEAADNGTLFLDEVGDMSMEAQAKVLRAVQEGKITRVGGNKDIKVNVRLVAATNKNLAEEIDKGNFRLDLYHRLSVILIHVPSLNQRKEDIPKLANKFLKDACKENGFSPKVLDDKAMVALQDINWTGNIRELRNVIERLVILCDKTITEKDVKEYSNPPSAASDPSNLIDKYKKFQDFKEFAEKIFIERKLKLNNWNIAKTALDIEIQRSHLYNKLDKYDIERK